MEISLVRDVYPQTAKLSALFAAAGRQVEADSLTRAVAQSPLVVSAWEDEKLVALARGITDGETVLLVADLAVDPAYDVKGLTAMLLNELRAMVPQIKRTVYLADAKDDTINQDWRRAQEMNLTAWVKEDSNELVK